MAFKTAIYDDDDNDGYDDDDDDDCLTLDHFSSNTCLLYFKVKFYKNHNQVSISYSLLIHKRIQSIISNTIV